MRDVPDPATLAAARVVLVAPVGAAEELAGAVAGLGHVPAAIATTASEALARIADVRPGVVLVDAALPGDPDGVALATEVRRRWGVPTLFVADAADDATLARLAAAEPARLVLRPLAERELRVELAMALRARRAYRAATELEERFFDVSLDLLCCLGFDGYFRRLSAAWEHTLGYTRDELMARPFIEFVHPDDRARTLAQNRAVRAGGRAELFENRYVCRDGSVRWLRWNAAPDPARSMIFSVARDVTERKRAAEEREALVAQLQTALAEVRSLRELLPICSYCRMIRDEDDRWHRLDAYIARHTTTRFSHGICPDCYAREVQPQLDALG